ncbi:HAAS signaling domain-containing protein [Nonomuraea terrae]|uniref:HAAS signaling domain-containing protein n=1 Tax=Nonomuraea terrae TaxID=2530383 RepID=UPI00379F1AE9
MTPDQYAQAVRAALADHPERDELLEDLDEHLAEIAAETDQPLESRLGPPQAYAEELAAAYGERPQRVRRRRVDPRGWAVGAHTRLMAQAPYRSFAGFLPELRPGWWVLRGYLLAMLLLMVTDNGGLVPGDVVGWVVVAVAVWASVWFGRRSGRGRRAGRVVAVTANALAVIALMAGLDLAASAGDRTQVAVARPEVWVRNASSDGVYNIKPYAKDGTPLADVYLYDQDGNPLITHPERYGHTVDRSCGEPILNRYPLPLIDEQAVPRDHRGMPRPAPSVCPAPGPTATPAATPDPAVTVRPVPSGTPTPSPARSR